MPVTITQVEEALGQKFLGGSIEVLDRSTGGPVTVPVRVFIDDPDREPRVDDPEIDRRVYPSIVLYLVDLNPAPETFDSDEDFEVGIEADAGTGIRTATMQNSPEWYYLRFQIHTYALDAAADRALLRWVETRMRPRDSLQIEGEWFWTFRRAFAKADSTDGDRKVYHNVQTRNVLVDFDNTETQYEVKQVREIVIDLAAGTDFGTPVETHVIDDS